MARTLNKVQLIGRLGADPEAHSTSNGGQLTTFSLATNRQWTGQDGTLNTETDWHRIVAWGTLGETCAAHLRKGRLVYIEGRLSTRAWESEGQKYQRTEVVASDMLMLDSKPDEADLEPQRTASASSSKPVAGKGRNERRPVEVEEEEDLLALPF
jgi:single-strand DNA-binding protein